MRGRSTVPTWDSRCSRPGSRCRSRPSGPAFEEGLRHVVGLGGDTDTNAAVAGALLGALHGALGLPGGVARSTRRIERRDRGARLRALAELAGRREPDGSGRIAPMAASDDPREVREERRVITAVFADLVGSTALGERLDPEELKLIVGDAVARVIGAVESFGGTDQGPCRRRRAGVVRRTDGARGRPRAGGARVAADRRGDRGLRRRRSRTPGASTGSASGSASRPGPVVVGAIGAGSRVEYAALGDAVNTAARLQSAAEPGAVLVGEATFRLVEPMFDWGAADELQLKGKSAPVVARVAQARDRCATRRMRGLEGVAGAADRPRAGARRADARRSRARSPAPAASCSSPESPASARRGWWPSCATCSRRGARSTVVRFGSRVDACPTASPCRTGRSATCCAAGSGVLADEPELRVRVALRRMVERLFGARAGELSPYLAALLGLTLEPDAAKRLAELSPEALQYRTFEVVREVIAPARRGRGRWPSCWRTSTGRMPRRSSCSSGCSATRKALHSSWC